MTILVCTLKNLIEWWTHNFKGLRDHHLLHPEALHKFLICAYQYFALNSPSQEIAQPIQALPAVSKFSAKADSASLWLTPLVPLVRASLLLPSFCPQPPQMSCTSSFESKRFASKDHFNAVSFLPVESWPTVPDSHTFPAATCQAGSPRSRLWGRALPLQEDCMLTFHPSCTPNPISRDCTWFSPYALPRYPEALPG